jgi:tetratricopeptide (TPR) repeat protein
MAVDRDVSHGNVAIQDADVAGEALERARQLVHSGDDLGAHAALSGAIKKGCAEPILKMRRAQVYILLGAEEPALLDLIDYLSACPGDGEALFNKGYVLSRLRRPVEAKACYEEAARLGFNTKELRDCMARVRVAIGEGQRTLESLKAVEPGKRDKDYWWRRVLLEVELGDLAAALASAQTWADSMSDDVWAKWGLGFVMQAKGAWQDARAVFEEIGNHGHPDDANRALATIAALRGDWAEVGRLTARVLERFPDDQRMLRLHAFACLTEGNYEQFRKLSAARPSSGDVSRK